MPWISSSLDETIAQLDVLNQSTTARKRADFEALQGLVGRLGDPFGGEDDIVVAREGREQAPRIGRPDTAPDPEPFVPLPRTTGNPWGASLRAKFIAEARDRGGW